MTGISSNTKPITNFNEIVKNKRLIILCKMPPKKRKKKIGIVDIEK